MGIDIPNIAVAQCDDWVAIYKDSQKVFEGHSCSLREGLRLLDISYIDIDLHPYDELISEAGDYFPDKVEDINSWIAGLKSD